MPSPDYIAGLIIKSLHAPLPPAESQELEAWMSLSAGHRETVESFLDDEKLRLGIKDHWVEKTIWQRLERLMEADATPVRRLPARGWSRAAAAAVLLLLPIGAGYFLTKTRTATPIASGPAPGHGIAAPQHARATLTLADGTRIGLDTAASGLIARQGAATVSSVAPGQLVYTLSSTAGPTPRTPAAPAWNTVSNPRGSQPIHLALSDGTKVWLNAESSLHYLTTFTGSNRHVDISGEAYFEATPNPHSPFIVQKGETNITVLGTRFNVNMFDEEPAEDVTLLDGAVKVSHAAATLVLKPGQQARVGEDRIRLHTDADLEAVMAWKNGRFQFEGAGTEQVMRQIARWYDVDIVYERKPKEQHFRGTIPRSVDASHVLAMLAGTGAIHFRIEGRKIIVLP